MKTVVESLKEEVLAAINRGILTKNQCNFLIDAYRDIVFFGYANERKIKIYDQIKELCGEKRRETIRLV